MEGIAVDPALKRVYALIVYERAGEEEGGTRRHRRTRGGHPLRVLDGTDGQRARSGRRCAGGVLASESVLHAQSEAVGNPPNRRCWNRPDSPLDPKTGDVIILGQEDKGGEERLVAVQRVHSNGTLGARWVDTTECFEGEGTPACTDEEGASVGATPTSPVATPGGRILVELQSDLWEIPAGFVSGEAPKLVLRFNNPLQNLIEFPVCRTRRRGRDGLRARTRRRPQRRNPLRHGERHRARSSGTAAAHSGRRGDQARRKRRDRQSLRGRLDRRYQQHRARRLLDQHLGHAEHRRRQKNRRCSCSTPRSPPQTKNSKERARTRTSTRSAKAGRNARPRVPTARLQSSAQRKWEPKNRRFSPARKCPCRSTLARPTC